MVDKAGKIILVIGATGQQGGTTARHLLDDGWAVRALTRNPSSAAAQALVAAGAEVVAGDLDDRASMDAAMRGVYGVFSVQTFWERGPAVETQQGILAADAAKAAGVQHLVYSSVGGAERNTGIGHFESKWLIEQHIQAIGLPATILRPVFFMDNLASPFGGIQSGVFASPVEADVTLQMLASRDVGAFAARVFDDPQTFIGQAIELAGDALTPPQIAAALGRALGYPIQYVPVPIDVIRQQNEDGADMFEWFNQHGYAADVPALRAWYPGLRTFNDWLASEGAAKINALVGAQTAHER